MRLFLGRLFQQWRLHPFFGYLSSAYLTCGQPLKFEFVPSIATFRGRPVAGILPVISQRIIFNPFSDPGCDYLLDENHFIPQARPFDFVDVTACIKTASLQP